MTALALKPLIRFSLSLGLVLVAVAGIFYGFSSIFSDNHSPQLIAPNGNIAIEIVNDDASRILGLSGRAELSDDQGMLFEFDDSSTKHCFWMKDMKFSIDIVWLDQNKNVVEIKDDVSPDTYPNSFCPDKPAKYVLEVASGRAEELGIIKISALSW